MEEIALFECKSDPEITIHPVRHNKLDNSKAMYIKYCVQAWVEMERISLRSKNKRKLAV